MPRDISGQGYSELGNVLSEPNCSIAKAVTQAIVIECCSVENTAVVPDCYHEVS